jgi:hypothetical protein
MKKLLALALATAALLSVAAVSVSEGPILPWRVQVDLTFAPDGTVASASPQVFFSQAITINGDTLTRDRGSVTWDSVEKRTATIAIRLADGSTATTTRGAVLASILAIAAEERTAAR